MVNYLIIAAILASIALGYKFKNNIAIFGITFAYLIGAGVVGLKPKAIIALWPSSLFFFIFAVTFFYGFALSNGTLVKFSEKGIYLCRKRPYLIPVMLYFLAFGMSGIGAGPFAVFAFLAPLIMLVASQIEMNKVLAAVIIVGAGVAGGYTPISLCTATVKSVLGTVGYDAEQIAAMMPLISWNNMQAQFILFGIAYIVFKGYKVKAPENLKEPEPFTPKQKTTLVLIFSGLIAYTVFPLLVTLFPHIRLFAAINSNLDTGLIAMALTAVALLLRIGNEKDALACVPWNTILLICGMGMLIAVSVKAGAIVSLSKWMGANVSSSSAPLIMAVAAGCMSFFSSTLGVVAPTLGGLIPGISQATGVSATAMTSIMMIAGHFAGLSPFSTGGAMSLTGVRSEEEKNKLMLELILMSGAAILLSVVMVAIGVIQ